MEWYQHLSSLFITDKKKPYEEIVNATQYVCIVRWTGSLCLSLYVKKQIIKDILQIC